MTDETFEVGLAGRSWSVPHLPFRLIKSIQPALFKVYAESARLGDAALSEVQIDDLATATWKAVAFVDPNMSLDDFLTLPFSVGDLLAALPAVSQAVGLRIQSATAEASPEMGKSTSTV